MSAVESLVAPTPSSTRLTQLGGAFIALAFLGPFLAAAVGIGETSAYQAGKASAETCGSLLVLLLIALAATRGRTDLTKARARLMVGLLLCLVVGTNIARADSDLRTSKAFVLEAVKFRDAQAVKFANLAERFDRIDISKAVTPDAIATSAGRAAGTAVLANYRALLAERRALVQTYLLEMERFVNERAPAGDAHAGAVAGMAGKKEATVKLYAGLDEAQTRVADSMERILVWSASQGDTLQIQNGRLMFADEKQRAELLALADQLTQAERQHDTTLAAAQAAQRQAQSDMADQNRRVEEFTRK